MTKIIYQLENGGVAVVHPTGEVDIDTLVRTVVPDGADYEIVEDTVIPADKTFRNAWRKDGATIVENLEAAKEIAHDKRRMAREEEFKPHDELIMKQIPGADNEAAEASRAAIRTKYQTMQTAIDAATTTAAIKSALEAD
tara:strand:+ start:451 stop:870 length:420 start_codon:yes stop_codon:yes gene_type:complete